MSSRPPVELAALREIGWREWDPIGLQTIEGAWQGSDAADEYDSYLLHVAAQLQKGETDGPLVDYLINVETERMGLTPSRTTHSRAAATVSALREYVQTLP